MTPYYDHDGVTIYHGDCLDVLPTLGQVDHVITDPPFTQRTSENARSRRDKKDGGAFIGDPQRRVIDFDGVDGQEAALSGLFLGVSLRWCIVFCALEQIGPYSTAASECWVRGTVWKRTNSAPQFTGDRPGQACEGIAIMHRKGRKRWNRGGTSLVYDGPTINSVGDRDRGIDHPTPKPEWLMAQIVADFTDPGETILDPFMGSGTTLVAAKRLGRKAIGIEREEKYCESAAKRLAQGALPLF
jgi:site-specific DNA-methyltransferase (adenine-specific)